MNEGFNAQTKQSDEWWTPDWLFKTLDSEFGFNYDGAALPENTKCKNYCIRVEDQSWKGFRVFCNPPYSNIDPFVQRAFEADIAVLLLPVRTDSDWFRVLLERRVELRWFRRRIDFWRDGQPVGSPRFPNLVAVVR